MQKLQFEEKWDQTIAEVDRKRIENVFVETKENNVNMIESITLWHANNYKNELLVTVLIHNRSDETLKFDDTLVEYNTESDVLNKRFTIPSLVIPPHTSMPWTFIFQNHNKMDDLGAIHIHS